MSLKNIFQDDIIDKILFAICSSDPYFSVVENNNIEKPHYNSLSDMYASMGYKNGRYKKQLNE